MTTNRKIQANRRNAQLSTGPRDTGRTRWNARTHGILSSEVLIRDGEGREDAEVFRSFADGLRADLEPVGALEELLLGKIIAAQWRLQRVLRYENGAIQERGDSTNSEWHQLEERKASIGMLEAELDALSSPDPLNRPYDIRSQILAVAGEVLNRDPSRLIDEITTPPSGEVRNPHSEIERIVNLACEKGQISVDEFLQRARASTIQDIQRARADVDKRQRVLEIQRLLVSLPSEDSMKQIQRYEAHLSRELYKALHELQRLQEARLYGLRSVPLTVDVNLSGNSGGTAP